MKQYKTIGILGGMGPEATVELYGRIIKIFQGEFGAVFDSDFPEIIILNLPIPDVVETSLEQKKVKQMLIEGSRKIEVAGADFIAIPCNTVMLFLDDIKKNISIPTINIVEETTRQIKKSSFKNIGLLGTKSTINNNLYGKCLKNKTVRIPTIQEQEEITKIIVNILAGRKNNSDWKKIRTICLNLKKQGATKIILGCTDLPLLYRSDDTIDTIDVLARAVVRESTKNYINKRQLGKYI